MKHNSSNNFQESIFYFTTDKSKMYLINFWQKKNSNPMNRQTVEKMTEWHDLCKVFQGALNIVNLLVILVLTAIDIINVLQNSSGGEKNKCQDNLRHGSDRKFMTHM